MSIARTAALSLAAASLLVSSAALAERQVGVDVSVGVGVGPAAPPPAPPPPAPAPGPVYQPAPAPGPVYSATPAPAGQGAWVPPPPAARREYEHKVLTLDINPFAMMIGRIGPNIQILPTPHHALVINPFWWVTRDQSYSWTETVTYRDGSSTTTTDQWKARFGGVGVEIGYRFYTAPVSAQGFYIGPSLVYARYDSSEIDAYGNPYGTKAKATQVGWALDAGFQKVFWSGFTLGAGIGLQSTKTTDANLKDNAPNTYAAFNRVMPRFLFSLGWSY